MKKLIFKIDAGKIASRSLLFLTLFLCTSVISQEYRSVKAYVNDFGRNEMFIKKSLIEYSETLQENQVQSRSLITSSRIIDKLSNINSVLKANDKGFENDTSLRDGFIKMTAITINYLKNGNLILNDYLSQSKFSFNEIEKNLKFREVEVNNYYAGIREYEGVKKAFGEKFDVKIKVFNYKNLFEYNAKQNILFYKINVIDQKLMALMNEKNQAEVDECLTYLNKIHSEVIASTEALMNEYNDNSLNRSSINYANFILSQKEKLVPAFHYFMDHHKVLEPIKKSPLDTKEAVDNYNEFIQKYNTAKNYYFDTLELAQNQKKALFDSWIITNSKFLKNNIEFENIHEAYTDNED